MLKELFKTTKDERARISEKSHEEIKELKYHDLIIHKIKEAHYNEIPDMLNQCRLIDSEKTG